MSPIEVIQKAICCPSGNCYAIEYNAKYPQKHQHPCMSHTKEPEATAALLALSQMEPTPGMELEGKSVSWCTGENGFSENCVNCSEVFRAMLAAAVKEGE